MKEGRWEKEGRNARMEGKARWEMKEGKNGERKEGREGARNEGRPEGREEGKARRKEGQGRETGGKEWKERSRGKEGTSFTASMFSLDSWNERCAFSRSIFPRKVGG